MIDSRATLVIGYGNTLRHDDGVGPRGAEIVQGWCLPGVSTLSLTQLTPELAEPLAAVRLAIFLDARVIFEGDPVAVEIRSLEPSEGFSTFGHSGDPRRLLSLAQAIYGRSPTSWLVTVPAVDVGLGEGLSARSARGLDQALTLIAGLLP